jgi:DNA mismatch repair protein MutS
MAQPKKLTPMMQQYFNIKARHQDVILFFQLGDFYETFYEDAELCARELDLVLTQREGAPMAGVPIKKASVYINRLLKKGYKVAICDQIQDPSEAKGVVERDVVRIVTPGTVLDEEVLEPGKGNYIAAIWRDERGRIGLAVADVSTGEFRATELTALEEARHELARLQIAELVLPDRQADEADKLKVDPEQRLAITTRDRGEFRSEAIQEHFALLSLESLGLTPLAAQAAGGLLLYLKETQKEGLQHLSPPVFYSTSEFMQLDPFTQRNLELVQELRTGGEGNTLLSVLNETVTGMGERLLRKWLLAPLLDRQAIEKRLNIVEFFYNHELARRELRDLLAQVYDVERLAGKLGAHRATPRDLLSLQQSLSHLPALRAQLQALLAEGDAPERLRELAHTLEALQLDEIARELQALREDAPLTLKEGDIFREGFFAELDALKAQEREYKQKILQLEQKERERTKIPSLKVGYNTVFGYYIEVTKVHTKRVPSDYIRKQTLTQAERYVTPELKNYEEKILSAQERAQRLEYELFCQLRDRVAARVKDVQKLAQALAELDVYSALAEVAKRRGYSRPEFTDRQEIEIVEGRHPVIEAIQRDQEFVPNDLKLSEEETLVVLTGPNMSGKCVSGDTLVFTDRGLLTIEELRPKNASLGEFAPLHCLVQSRQGRQVVTHFYIGGRQNTLKITTRLGFQLEGTPEHRVWVRFSDGREGWKRLDELQLGDVVAIARQLALWGSEAQLHTPRAWTLKHVKRYRLPTKLDEDLAYFLGLLIGDGTLTYRDAVTLSTADEFIQKEFCRIAQRLFGYRVGIKANGKDLFITSRQIRVFLEELGLGYTPAHEKRVPPVIRRAPKPLVIAFLQGLFDADGYAENRYGNVRLATSSPHLAREVQMLLLNLGILASLHVKETKYRPSYQLFIDGIDAIAFHERVGFRLPRKRARSSLASSLRRPNVGGIPHLASTLKAVQARIVATRGKPQALKHNKRVNSIFYTYLPNGRNISYDKLDELISYCQTNGVPCPELEALQHTRYFYDYVEKIEPSEADVYDLSVEEEHSYVANGFVSHNSTFLRQNALICLMAQMGSFVPAKRAALPIVDKIFTRVGASDMLAFGYSTFMVEMIETANILNNATERSLVILDEMGRGTSTFDGVSIAWAVAEHLVKNVRAKTLFATHYHELTLLAEKLPGVVNMHVLVKEYGDEVIFLHRVERGVAEGSYGVHVAKLAGLPQDVIERASEILHKILQGNPLEAIEGKKPHKPKFIVQPALFGGEPHPVVEELKKIDVERLTPIEALNLLAKLKEKL